MRLTVIAIALVLGSATSAFAAEAPVGWRFPTETDYSDDWVNFRDLIPVPFHARGDFNGDGTLDDAWILLRTDSERWGLFVFLSDKASTGTRLIRLRTHVEGAPAQWHAVAVVPPGEYLTTCGTGVTDCEKGDERSIKLQNAGFKFMVLGKTATTYYWHPAKKTFRYSQTSD